MLKVDRQAMIGQILAKKGSVRIPDLSRVLSCSVETIRRDLKELDSAGKLTRTHGGAYLVERYTKNADKTYNVPLPQEKARIAKQALRYVRENDVLMLDSSTTSLVFAQSLIQSKLSVVLITNSLLICDLCNEQPSNISLISVGGQFSRAASSFTGYHTTDALSRYHADKTFISCPRVTLEHGLSDNDLNEAKVREMMMQKAQQCFLLADHTKFGASANILFGDLEKVDFLVTDWKLPSVWEDYARRTRLKIDCCGETERVAPVL